MDEQKRSLTLTGNKEDHGVDMVRIMMHTLLNPEPNRWGDPPLDETQLRNLRSELREQAKVVTREIRTRRLAVAAK